MFLTISSERLQDEMLREILHSEYLGSVVVGFIREQGGNANGVSVGVGRTPGFALGIELHERSKFNRIFLYV